MTQRFDVVVVGARCAGAAFATFLAEGGARVLLVDRAKLPSDVVLSTHTIHPSGMRVVDELGLADEVRRVTPEMSRMRIDWCGGVLDLEFPKGHGECCPRRRRFDELLQTRATAVGVELRDRTSLTRLEKEGERVVGVHLQAAGGETELVRAALVVGADGRSSTVAQLVGAHSYFDYEPPRGIYWSYWPAPDGWGTSKQYPSAMYMYRSGNTIHVAFHTDEDQLLLGALPLRRDIAAFRAAPLVQLQAALAPHPMLGPIAQAAPTVAVRGYLGERYFFRQPVGPGWLLLGDAGLYKDFLSGDGMSEAMIQARTASRAFLGATSHAGLESALVEWALLRDLEALPHYANTRALAAPDVGSVLNRVFLTGVNSDPALKAAFAQTFSRERTPQNVVPAWRIAGWALGAAMRGEWSALPEFLRQAQSTAKLTRELVAIRRKLSKVDEQRVADLGSRDAFGLLQSG